MNKKVLIVLLALLIVAFTLTLKFFSSSSSVDNTLQQDKETACLDTLYFDKESFDQDIAKAQDYQADTISAGIVPHHLLAGELIASFFKTVNATEKGIDTVVIIGPNHKGSGADISLADCGWQTQFGTLTCDDDIVKNILSCSTLAARADNELIETDHAASDLIPYAKYYLPDAKVVTILLSRQVTLQQTEDMAEVLAAQGNDKKILVVGSIDFSHGLSVEEGKKRDEGTLAAINHHDLAAIKKMSNEHLDSPETLCTLLSYMKISANTIPSLLDHKNAADYLNRSQVEECTTYFVFTCQNDTLS